MSISRSIRMYTNLLVTFASLAAAAGPQPPLIPRLFAPTDVGTLPLPRLVFNESLSLALYARAGNLDDHTIPNTKFLGMNGYQWDQTVEGDQYPQATRVINAWNTALEMATAARDSIKDLTPELLLAKAQEAQDIENAKKKPKRLTDAQKRKSVRQWITSQFPAYTQMFGAALDQHVEEPNIIPTSYGAPKLVHDRLDKLLKNIEDINAVGRPETLDPQEPEAAWKRNGLLIYLTRHESPHDLNGVDNCGEGTQAFAIQVRYFRELQSAGAGKPDDNAWVINFCKPFFELPVTSELLQDLKDNKKSKEDVCDISKHDGTARVLLHEITHLGFTLNLSPYPDIVGFDEIASNSAARTGKPQAPKFDDKKRGMAEMSDAYAWFGVYSYLNALDACQGVHWSKVKAYEAAGGCIDTWPPYNQKYVRNS